MAAIYWYLGVFLYIFQYVNAAQSKPLVRSICDVSDETNSARFNFTKLASTKDYVIKDESSAESIRLQLCGPLREPCNNTSDYGVCLKKGKKEIGIGKAPPVVTAISGKVEFKFIGDECKINRTYKVDIIVKCDNEDKYESQPELFPHRSDDCSFYILWKTKAACSKEITSSCKVADKNGQNYDLGPLTLRSDNYEIPMNDAKSTVILNVCHSIAYNEGAACEIGSGACLREIGDGDKNKYKNLGDVNEPPYFENDVLTLKYTFGEMCFSPNNADHVETVISFECDYHATNTRPIYAGGAEECRHRFHWRTSAACSIEALKNHSETTAGKCKVTNPLTNVEYNLQDLMEKDYHGKTPNGIEYVFQVCGPVANSSCPSGSGGCLAKNGTATGLAKTKLMWSQGGPYLNYTNGDVCGAGQRRYTVIAFFCGAEGSTSGPIIMEDENCALIIHWNTLLVCENKRITCETADRTVSLTSLIRSTDNYVVKAKDTEFHINVCRSLVPKPYLTCLHGSAACQVIPEVNSQFTNETSIGYPDGNPVVDKEKHVILRYTGGSQCPEDSHNKISSNFTFLCDYTSAIGEPRYKYYKSCTHVFEWTTSVVCDKIDGRWIAGCMVENPRLSHKFNLTSLRDKPVHSVKSPSGGQYNISICGGENYCNGSVVCKGNDAYGKSPVVIFDYNQNMIRHKFVNGTKCGNGLYWSEVQFVCDKTAGNGEPKLIWESTCSVAFEWRTNVFCIDRSTAQSPIKFEPKVEETSENIEAAAPGHVGVHVTIVILITGSVALIIYLWSSERRARIRACFGSLTSRREHSRARYTKVNATEEARLLLDIADRTQCHSDSDSDDELLDA